MEYAVWVNDRSGGYPMRMRKGNPKRKVATFGTIFAAEDELVRRGYILSTSVDRDGAGNILPPFRTTAYVVERNPVW